MQEVLLKHANVQVDMEQSWGSCNKYLILEVQKAMVITPVCEASGLHLKQHHEPLLILILSAYSFMPNKHMIIKITRMTIIVKICTQILGNHRNNYRHITVSF